MAWTLEDVKDHLGITDPNQDADKLSEGEE